MGAKRKVTKREYGHWVKWLNKQGYSGPFAELTTKHECVRLLARELKRDPSTIPETRRRDPRTIVSNLNYYGRMKYRSESIKRGSECPYPYELPEASLGLIDESKVLNRLSELSLMKIQGVPQYLYQLSQQCHTPGLIICSREFLQKGIIAWIECLGPCYLSDTGTPRICREWDQCLQQRGPTLQERRLFVGYDIDNRVWLRLPGRFKYPDLEKTFPALSDITLYRAICNFEERGAIYVHQCEQLLPYLENPDTDSVTTAVENPAPGRTRKLPDDILRHTLQALNAWNQQASAIRAWGELLKSAISFN
jgi:hypothetical protein